MSVKNCLSNKLIKSAFLMYLIVLALLSLNMYLPDFVTANILYLFIIVCVIIFRRYEGISIKWRQVTILEAMGGAILGGVLIAIIFAVNMLVGWIQLVAINTQDKILITGIGIIFLHALIAIGEELSFREYIFRNFLSNMNISNAIVLSSFMFSLVHLPWIIIIGMAVENAIIMCVTLFLNGVLLAILYMKSGLIASIGFHFVWNFLQYNILGLRSGFVSLLELTYESPILLTGGQYGPEAGLIGILMMGVGIVVALKYFKGRTEKVVYN